MDFIGKTNEEIIEELLELIDKGKRMVNKRLAKGRLITMRWLI